jgi:hypothetical protein
MAEPDFPISDNQERNHDNCEITAKEFQQSVNVRLSRTIYILNVTLIVLSTILCVLLIIQFFLGMAVNVYVTLQPLNISSYNDAWSSGLPSAFYQNFPVLKAHIVFAFILALTGTIYLIVAIIWSILSGGGLTLLVPSGCIGVWAGIFMGIFNGVSYLGFGEEVSSMLMATGWIISIVSLVIVSHIGRISRIMRKNKVL